MSGAGVAETPNAAVVALSAWGSSLSIAGLLSGITELEHFLKTGDDKAFTEGQDRRCRTKGRDIEGGQGDTNSGVNVQDRQRPRQVDGVCLHRHSPSSRRRGAAALGS